MMSSIQFFKEKDFTESKFGFRISQHWHTKFLSQIVELIKNGLVLPQDNVDNGYPITRIETISDGNIDLTKVGRISALSDDLIDNYRLQSGDILFSHINSLSHIGKTAIYEGEPKLLIHGMNLLLLRPNKSEVDPYFLLYLLRFWKTKNIFKAMAKKAVNQASINQTELNKLQIHIPQISEQQKISAILSLLEHYIEKTEEVITKIEKLKRGIMHELLTKGIGHKEFKDTALGIIPKDWKISTIGNECIIGTGGTPSRTNDLYFGGNIPWVKSTEVNYEEITETEEHITELGLKNSNAKLHPKGTLVIAMYGQGVTRGKCGILGIDATINQACAAIRPKENNPLYIPYLYYWCQFKYDFIRTLGQGANQLNLNLFLISTIPVLLPSFQEQQKIAEMLKIIDTKLDLERTEKKKIESVKKVLMDLLLTGTIRVKV